MKKLLLMPLCTVFSLALFSSCSTQTAQEGETEVDTAAVSQNEITIVPAPPSVDYPDAILQMTAPAEGSRLSGEDSAEFAYEVTNFELAAPTPDADEKQIAKSPQGQHIHLILNNEPYHAIYEPPFKLDLEDGHYVALSFLSRSYHESVKTPDAYKLSQFTVGEGEEEEVDLSAPMLFYSRPKGTYTGEDTERLLFDFYLVNTDISSTGNQVKVTVNSDTTFMVDQWEPYILEGLPMGENSVKIELVDSEGNLIDSPFNSEERTFTLESAATEPTS